MCTYRINLIFLDGGIPIMNIVTVRIIYTVKIKFCFHIITAYNSYKKNLILLQWLVYVERAPVM